MFWKFGTARRLTNALPDVTIRRRHGKVQPEQTSAVKNRSRSHTWNPTPRVNSISQFEVRAQTVGEFVPRMHRVSIYMRRRNNELAIEELVQYKTENLGELATATPGPAPTTIVGRLGVKNELYLRPVRNDGRLAKVESGH